MMDVYERINKLGRALKSLAPGEVIARGYLQEVLYDLEKERSKQEKALQDRFVEKGNW